MDRSLLPASGRRLIPLPCPETRKALLPRADRTGKASCIIVVRHVFYREEIREEIRCQFIILARKDEPTPDYADTGLRPHFRLGHACAHFRLGHRAPGRGGRQAQTVSGCLNSAFLDISQHFTGHLFRPWIPSSARGIDGGSRRFTEVVFNELSLPVAGSGRVQETLPEPAQRIR